ncbi:MAG: VOC family protein [Catenulispora sp.]|nr:VOC family protein [Catenulispora sp.]
MNAAIPPTPPTPSYGDQVKSLARLLRADLGDAGVEISHSLALEVVAHQLGSKDWNVLAALVRRSVVPSATLSVPPAPSAPSAQAMRAAVPILRVMSVAEALPFYLDYLGFSLDWEHRFEAGMPLYVQVSRASAVLHLSEHFGDGSPNGAVWIPVRDVYALHEELRAHEDAPVRPGVDADAPGGATLRVLDPYGNMLRFTQVEG